MSERLLNAINRAQEHLLSRQTADGYFQSTFHMDLGLEADTIFLLRFLGIRDEALEEKLVNFILVRRLDEGGWSIYPGGPPELNTTIKNYMALKLKGFEEKNQLMVQDRQIILSLGGIEKSNSYNRFYLAMFGLGNWDAVPSIPPELVLLPNWSPVNIYDFSAWTRAIVVPLSIVWAFKPVRPLARNFNVDELYKSGRRMKDCGIKWDKRVISWKNFFLLFDSMFKLLYKKKDRRGGPVLPTDQSDIERSVGNGGAGIGTPPLDDVRFRSIGVMTCGNAPVSGLQAKRTTPNDLETNVVVGRLLAGDFALNVDETLSTIHLADIGAGNIGRLTRLDPHVFAVPMLGETYPCWGRRTKIHI